MHIALVKHAGGLHSRIWPSPANDVFVTGQFVQAHRAAGMELIRADADLGAKSELAAISESSRGVPINGRRVHAIEELFGRLGVTGDDCIAMVRAVAFHVVDSLVEIVDDAQRHYGVEILGGPVLFLGPNQRLVIQCCELGIGGLVSSNLNTSLLKAGAASLRNSWEMPR